MHSVCFVTGTRAEFGLMRSALAAIEAHPRLKLQLMVTGMHLDRSRGNTLAEIRSERRVDAVVAWKAAAAPGALAVATGRGTADIAVALNRLKTDIVLVVGDRVEAFAAAAAGAIAGRVVAHVHGGDRAMGQVDDSLRHAITKLAHVHFPATAESASRIVRLGEEGWRIHAVGSPGIDGIVEAAESAAAVQGVCPGLIARGYALVVMHPVDADEGVEEKRAGDLIKAIFAAGVPRVVGVYPNNDPGGAGIVRAWRRASRDRRCTFFPSLPRGIFLGLLRDAALLAGNSSSGIIEAGSFRTPVVDVGPRQAGRQRCGDVIGVAYSPQAIRAAVSQIWAGGQARRGKCSNPYAGNGMAGVKIAEILGRVRLDGRTCRKLIAY